KDATERVPERKAEAPLERLGDDRGDTLRVVAGLDRELLRLDQRLPVLLDHRVGPHARIRVNPTARPGPRPPCLAGPGGPAVFKRAGAWAAGSRCAGSGSRRGSK